MNVLFLIFKYKYQIMGLCVTNGSCSTGLTKEEKMHVNLSLALPPFFVYFWNEFQKNPPEIQTSWDEADF